VGVKARCPECRQIVVGNIGRQRKDRDGCLDRVFKGADLAGGFDTVKDGHVNVHQDRVKIILCEFFKRILPVAERHNVTIAMELLNSRVDHKDYMCDRTEWGVALCKAIDSERFGLLYDIYHMQIMEGDVIRTIRDNHRYIYHYHTGGNPGRNEIDETQELYYPAIMRAILATGYKGHVGQEFIPKRKDKLASLEQGVRICDV